MNKEQKIIIIEPGVTSFLILTKFKFFYKNKIQVWPFSNIEIKYFKLFAWVFCLIYTHKIQKKINRIHFKNISHSFQKLSFFLSYSSRLSVRVGGKK